jgi:ribosomal protein L11 methyltransferase
MDVGALSVSVEDADEGTDAEKPLFGEPAWNRPKRPGNSRVVALTDEDDDQA